MNKMQVTEAEAKKRICPIALSGDAQFIQKCFGSECMGWRWVGKENIDNQEPRGFCGVCPQFPSR